MKEHHYNSYLLNLRTREMYFRAKLYGQCNDVHVNYLFEENKIQ